MRSCLGLSATLFLLLSGCTVFDFGGGEPAKPPPLDPDLVQRGAALFRDARLSGDRSVACSTCHPGGGEDHLVYLAGQIVPAGTLGGLRTLSLRGLWQTSPYLWDESAPTVGDAVERMLRVEMRGGTLAGKDREALETYLLSIPVFDRRRIQPDGVPVEPVSLSARRGYAVFIRAECSACHPAPAFTRPGLSDVGAGGAFASPSLRGVSTAGPFGHDGRWADLESAVRAIANGQGLELDADEMAQLLAYLKLL
jgi:cytochrome c peroxidase